MARVFTARVVEYQGDNVSGIFEANPNTNSPTKAAMDAFELWQRNAQFGWTKVELTLENVKPN